MQRDDLWCEVLALAYDFELQMGRLYMAPGDCCDMKGCVALFERIDPGARRILTFAGPEPDTVYLRAKKGWISHTP